MTALMQAHGVLRIVTINVAHFRRYPFLEALSPEELLAEITVGGP